MADRRIHSRPVSELFSPDRRSGAGERKHRARMIRRLTEDMRLIWARHTIVPQAAFKARRRPPVRI